MFRNKKFGSYTVILCLAGIVYMFLCAGLAGGQLELLRADQTGGWSARQVELPLAVGGLLSVITAFACLTGYRRRGVRQGMIVWGAAAALGCVGLVNAAGMYWLFFASTVLLCCACTALQTGVAALCAAWFIRFRGRVTGVVMLGMPLFSAVGAPAVADLVRTRLAGDYRPLYLSVAAALALLALAVRFLLRDRPEDGGLYPDGDGRAPCSEPAEDQPPLTLGQTFRAKRTWLLLLSFGCYAAAAGGCMGSMEDRLLTLGGAEVWAGAAPWLALGAILALPASYAFGWLSDRLGVPGAGLLLGAGLCLAPAALWLMPYGGSVPMEILWALGTAAALGGVPTLLPCAVAHIFGRQQYLSAARVTVPAALLCAAAAPLPARYLLARGLGGAYYACLAALAVLGFLGCVLLRLVNAPGGKP